VDLNDYVHAPAAFSFVSIPKYTSDRRLHEAQIRSESRGEERNTYAPLTEIECRLFSYNVVKPICCKNGIEMQIDWEMFTTFPVQAI
jgi:hypothetical protein